MVNEGKIVFCSVMLFISCLLPFAIWSETKEKKNHPLTIHFLACCLLQKAVGRVHLGEGDTGSQSQKVIMSSFCPWAMSSLWVSWKCEWDAEGQSLWYISTQGQHFNTGCSPPKNTQATGGFFPFAVFFLFNIVTCRKSSVLLLYILPVGYPQCYICSKYIIFFTPASPPQTAA